MMTFSNPTKKTTLNSKILADAASWYCVFVLLALVLLTILKESNDLNLQPKHEDDDDYDDMVTTVGIEGNNLNLRKPPCDEIYVVGEGETLDTISSKCGDPFIVEKNPHIHDPDDVFPGLVIKVTPVNV